MKKKRIKRLFIWLIVLFILFTVYFWIPVTERIDLDVKGDGEPVRIVLITDLHSCWYGPGESWLISRIDKEKPDIVILSGDIFDDKIKDDNAKALLEDLVKKYPCYYVTGNHEFWSERAEEMKEYTASIGVNVLAGDCCNLEVNGRIFDICGVDDPTRMTSDSWIAQIDSAYSQTDKEHIRILVSHRPETVQVYENYDFDLILSGHAHAGQFRIPFINKGLFAPNQGTFAVYVSGVYTLSNGSRLVVSRGLARESTPAPRYFNHPEIVTIILK